MLTLLLITGMTQHPVNKVHTIHTGVFFHGMEVEEEVLPTEIKRYILDLWVRLTAPNFVPIGRLAQVGMRLWWVRKEPNNRTEAGSMRAVITKSQVLTVLALTRV